jgi:hypothetical protein
MFLVTALVLIVFDYFARHDYQTVRRVDLGVVITSIQFLALYPRLASNWPPRIKLVLDSLSISVS